MLARIPSLVQFIVVDILILVCLGAGSLARFTDAWGWNGPQPLFSPVNGVVWGATVIGLLLLFLLGRQIWKPRVQVVTWSPVRHFGSISVVAPGDSWGVRTVVFTNHPAYVFVDLVAGVLPLALVFFSWDDDVKYNPTMRLWHWALGVWAAIPIMRLLCWYVLRRRPDLGEISSSPSQMRKVEWELAWQPVIAFWVIAALVLTPALAVAFSVDKAVDPPLDASVYEKIVADNYAHEEQRFRITGKVLGELREWPADGKLHPAAGILMSSPGGDAVIVCTVHDLNRMKKNVAKARDGELSCTVRVMQPMEFAKKSSLPASIHSYVEHYNWRPSDFPPPAEGQSRLFLRWVDP